MMGDGGCQVAKVKGFCVWVLREFNGVFYLGFKSAKLGSIGFLFL